MRDERNPTATSSKRRKVIKFDARARWFGLPLGTLLRTGEGVTASVVGKIVVKLVNTVVKAVFTEVTGSSSAIKNG